MKKRYKLWLGILISCVFFFLFIRGMDLKEAWMATRQANYCFIFLSIVVNVATFAIRAERWKYLIDPIKRIRFPSLFSAVCIGFMGNSLLPARAGEFIRAYAIGRREGITKAGAFATIVTERLFDGLTLLVMLIIIMTLFPFPVTHYGSYITIGFLNWAVAVTSFLYGIVIVTLFLLNWKPDHIWCLMNLTLFRYLPEMLIKRIEVLYRAFLSGLESLKRGRHILSIGIYSILLWLVTACGIYLLFPAFSIRLDFLSAILIMVVVAIVVMLPSSPGFIGTFHLASSETLILLGINAHVAKTFAIVHHAACIVPVVILGLFYLSREQLSFSEIGATVPEKYKVLEKGGMTSEDPPCRQS